MVSHNLFFESIMAFGSQYRFYDLYASWNDILSACFILCDQSDLFDGSSQFVINILYGEKGTDWVWKMIVLASKSPRRKEILKSLGYEFIICPAKKDEVFDLCLTLDEALEKVALSKGKEVQEQYPDAIINS